MQVWWNGLTSSQRSALISAAGAVLSLVSLFMIPGLNQMGTHCAAVGAAFLTFLVAQASQALKVVEKSETKPVDVTNLSDGLEKQ